MTYNPKFNRKFNGSFKENSNFVSIKVGSEAYLIEDELNEMQWIQNTQRSDFIRSILNSGFLNSDNGLFSENNITIMEDENNPKKQKILLNIDKYMPVNINGYVFKLAGNNNGNIILEIPENKLSVEHYDTLYLQAWFEEIDYTDNNNIKKYGGELNEDIGVHSMDSRMNLKTSHRIQLKWNLFFSVNTEDMNNDYVYPFNDKKLNPFKLATSYLNEDFSKDKNLFVSVENNILSKKSIDGKFYAIPILKIRRKENITITDKSDITINFPKSSIQIGLDDGVMSGGGFTPSIGTSDEGNILEIKNKEGKLINISVKDVLIGSNGDSEELSLTNGLSSFNSVNGRLVNHKCNDKNYNVLLCPQSNSIENLGEYWIENKTDNNFTIKNTGSNNSSPCNWAIIKKSNEDFIIGSGTFNSTEGVNIEHNIDNSNYEVFITPIGNSEGSIGEYWIDSKKENSFIVKNTGSDKKTKFDWVLVKKETENIKMGSSKFNSEKGVKVTHKFNSLGYTVYIIPTSSLNGDLGEYWVESKLENSFVVKNTGSNNSATFDWVLIKNKAENGIKIVNNNNKIEFIYNNGKHAAFETGDLVVDGNETTIKSKIVRFHNNKLTLNSENEKMPKDGCGIDIHRSGKQPATFYWNEEKLCWMAGISGKEQKIATFNFGKDGEKGKATGSKILFICIDSNKIYFDNDIDNWLQVGGSDSIKWSQVTEKPTKVNDIDSNFHYDSESPVGNTRLNYNGDFYATRVFNAVYNDYAEYFKRKDVKEDLEPGDVIICDTKDKYTKSEKAYNNLVVGVYSDSYGHCIGGEGLETDDEKYIPIGLSGRVSVKVIGKINKGDLLVSSDIAGVAMKSEKYIPGTVIGKALENYDSENIGKIKMLIMNI